MTVRASLTVRLIVLACFLALPVWASGNGQTTRATSASGSDSATGGQVKLWVLATGAHRKLVLDLSAKDFQVFEDNRQQQITSFSRRTTEPLALGLLIETSRSRLYEPDPTGWRPYSEMLHKLLRPGDRAFVTTFAEDVATPLAPFTGDLGELDRALQQAFSAPPKGTTGLYDAIYTLSEERFAGEPARKALLVVSDSPDDYSFHNQLQTLERIRRAGVTVYTLLPWVDREGQPPFGAVEAAQLFAAETGGLFFQAFNRKMLAKQVDGIRIALTYSYALGYTPSDRPRDGKYHSVRIKCVRRGVKLYVSQGYYAPAS
jgi:Ca-activated chloride channel homolog